jgi:hypothetical protein
MQYIWSISHRVQWKKEEEEKKKKEEERSVKLSTRASLRYT